MLEKQYYKPVGIYNPICPAGEDSEQLMDELALYGAALALYRMQYWGFTEEKFGPNNACMAYIPKRIVYFHEHSLGAGLGWRV